MLVSLVHLYETEPNINVSMIFDHATAGKGEIVGFFANPGEEKSGWGAPV